MPRHADVNVALRGCCNSSWRAELALAIWAEHVPHSMLPETRATRYFLTQNVRCKRVYTFTQPGQKTKSRG